MSDSCCDTSSDSEKTSCADSYKPFTRWLPYLLLILAAALYIHSLTTKSKNAKVAAIVRAQASEPFSQVMVAYRLEGRNTAILAVCPPNLASNLMHTFTTAAPMSPFRRNRMLEGTRCEIIVTHTNGTRSAFVAARLDNDPLTLYVGTILPENVSGTNVLRLSTPTKVENAGPILGQIIDEIIQLSETLPSDEILLERARNTAKRVQEELEKNDSMIND